jgi:hypothetical protein
MVFKPICLKPKRGDGQANAGLNSAGTTIYHYGANYREAVRLPSGVDVVIRAVSPSDKWMLVEGMKGLSPTSRRARFSTDKTSADTPVEEVHE